jgi:CRISPR system Cascade subunit CasA
VQVEMNNLIHDPLLRIETLSGIEQLSLPGVFAALVADRVESFPALRAHQAPAWHMFLAQLGAIAMHRAELAEPPRDSTVWLTIIRALTKADFPDDEPWQLVVADKSKPAFMQPPVPDGLALDSAIQTPDALDMLITSKNHDLKQAVAAHAQADDWIFALISLQTCEGYGGSGNYGATRMNGGSSSRALLGIAPMGTSNRNAPGARIGLRFKRDAAQLIVRRTELIERFPVGYPSLGGCALIWAKSWPQGAKLSLSELDIFFIEVCRRVRFVGEHSALRASIGTSSAARIEAQTFNGAVGDPWAPIHVLENKALTLGDEGEFDYKRIVDLMMSGNWTRPLLATLGPNEAKDAANWVLIAQAFARGNSKTGGFKERFIPITGRSARGLGPRHKELHELAKQQIAEIDKIDKILRNAIALAAASGEPKEVAEKHYIRTRPYRSRLTAEADRRFFEALWQRFDAETAGDATAVEAARAKFVQNLVTIAEALFEEAAADVPCAAINRPRAEARARRRFKSGLRHKEFGFPEYYAPDPVAPAAEEDAHDAA